MAMPAIQALGVAYEVYAVTDASGGVSAEVHEMAVLRMEQAGVVPITWFAVVGELRRDWARLEPAVGLAEVLAQHAGGSGIAFAWETQLMATPVPEEAVRVGAEARRSFCPGIAWS